METAEAKAQKAKAQKEKAQKGRELNLSYPASFNRRSKAVEVSRMVEALMVDFKKWSGLQRVSPAYYVQFTTILLELLLVARSIALYLTIPRDHRALKGLNERVILNVFDYLIARGYVAQVQGFNAGDFGRRSQLRPTIKLQELWVEYGVKKYMIDYNRPGGVRITKKVRVPKAKWKHKQRAETITIDATPVRLPRKMDTMVRNLKAINAGLATLRISHTMDQELQERLYKKMGYVVDLPDNQIVQLKRVLTEKGKGQGRFWSITFPYQNLPEWCRETFLINGQEVTERDIQATFINILYAERGLRSIGDPYQLENYRTKHRDFIKRVTNIMLNSTSPEGVIATLRSHEIKNPLGPGTVKSLMEAIRKKHDKLDGVFFTKQNSRLTLIESNICEAVLLKMLKGSRGILPVLPEHDSFMVLKQHGPELEAAMIESFQEILNVDCRIGISKKY